jgi:hypothetical protein
MLAGMENNTETPSLRELPPITDSAGLERTWQTVMGAPGFSQRQLWVLLLDPDGKPLMGTQVEDLPRRPEPEGVRNLVTALSSLDEDLSFAFLYGRPGSDACTADDLAWAKGLRAACRDNGRVVWPVHLGTDHSNRVIAPDDLADAG